MTYIECMSIARLSSADREFLETLSDVVFGNPFSRERNEQIVQLAPGVPLGDLTTHREALARVVGPRFEPWLNQGVSALQRLAAEDRRLLEPGFLYVCYHRCVPQIDALIERQAGQGGAPQTVTFGDEVLADLVRSGFPRDRAARYFAFFFQLRRTFYFIDQAFAGECESMRRLREALWNNVFTHDMRGYEAALWNRMEDFSTLLLGETGTGKGSAAAAIGRSEIHSHTSPSSVASRPTSPRASSP